MNRIAVAAAALISLTAAAQAGVGSTRGDCYNHVISACNKKDNVQAAHACANSGMNACDKKFPQASQSQGGLDLQAMRARILGEVRHDVETRATRVR